MSKVQVQILEHPTILNGKFAAIVDGLFSAEEMQAVIDRAESIGFSPAGVG
jgi:tellurite resistance protein